MRRLILSNKYIALILGACSSLIFAPYFCLPFMFTLSALCYQVHKSDSRKNAAIYGFVFGFGHFVTGLYWISIGVSVYIEDFWWALPFALFGLPIILACFTSLACFVSWYARNNQYYNIIFCTFWVFFEWVRSWIFTGFPWNLLGYSIAFSDTLSQIVSVISIYGIGFIIIYIAIVPYYLLVNDYNKFIISLLTSLIIVAIIYTYGALRLDANQTQFSDIKIRIVQPSIPQISKWDVDAFWRNLDVHIALSTLEGQPDLIIWSESALVVPYHYPAIKAKLLQMLGETKAILLTGGVTETNKQDSAYKIYTSLYALQNNGDILFTYHKSHLVPFGEYMPLRHILPLKKLTAGFVDYTAGNREIMHIEKLKLSIKPLICYESIFPAEVRTSNDLADVIVNVTNDAWYGNSSGPYQHFYISKMRAIENGIPLIRVANNGISAIIDSIGRVISKLNLNSTWVIDSALPQKISTSTIYSMFGDITAVIALLLTLLIHCTVKILLPSLIII